MSDGPNDQSDCADERIAMKDGFKDLNGDEFFVSLELSEAAQQNQQSSEQDNQIDQLKRTNIADEMAILTRESTL